MAAAYPPCFREKVVEAYEAGEGSFEKLGKRFCIGEATVNRWVSLKRRTGAVAPKARVGRPGSGLVKAEGEQFVRSTLDALPDSTLVELSAAYEEEFGTPVSARRMSDVVRRLGLTRKRGSSGHEPRSALTSSRSGKPSSKGRLR